MSIVISGQNRGSVLISRQTTGGTGTIQVSDRDRTEYRYYDGPTTVIPEPDEMQILQTEKKIVQENIVVMPIPYFETSNTQGGKTVYIGE